MTVALHLYLLVYFLPNKITQLRHPPSNLHNPFQTFHMNVPIDMIPQSIL